MSLINGKCPNCGAAMVLNDSKEIFVCRYCGQQMVIESAIQKCEIDGIATFDSYLINAQNAIDLEEDFDKARKYYKQALDLKPNDYRVLWGLFLCEIDSIEWSYNRKGFVQYPNDVFEHINRAINRYGNLAIQVAPNDVKQYYIEQIEKVNQHFNQTQNIKKKRCYIATLVYGSYNCPEVWVLRRYRDFYLDKKFFGKLFIKFYYKVSPILIKKYGNNKKFNNFWRKKLDKKIEKLKEQGYLDKPYDDKY